MILLILNFHFWKMQLSTSREVKIGIHAPACTLHVASVADFESDFQRASEAEEEEEEAGEVAAGRSSTWTNGLVEMLAQMHIPKLAEYNKYGRDQKERVSSIFIMHMCIGFALVFSVSLFSMLTTCVIVPC